MYLSTCENGKWSCVGSPCEPATCSAQQFACNASDSDTIRCIPNSWVCDKMRDCHNNEDEKDCGMYYSWTEHSVCANTIYALINLNFYIKNAKCYLKRI